MSNDTTSVLAAAGSRLVSVPGEGLEQFIIGNTDAQRLFWMLRDDVKGSDFRAAIEGMLTAFTAAPQPAQPGEPAPGEGLLNLPEPDGVLVIGVQAVRGYTANSMHAYAQQHQQPAREVPEAVAWYTDDHLNDRSATTYDKVVRDRWVAKGWPVTPLYAAPPLPAASPRAPAVDDAAVEAAVKAYTGMAEREGFHCHENAKFRHMTWMRAALTAVPPPPAVDDAMVERGLAAARDASDARLPRYSVVRAILTAALAVVPSEAGATTGEGK